MSPWQLIFRQSRVNNGPYDGDRLPAQNWHWPQGTWLQERLRYLRKASTNGPRMKYAHRKPDPSQSITSRIRVAQESETNAKQGRIPSRVSVVPLLLADEGISTEAHRALLEHRLEDAAEMFMQKYGLTCIEAGDLLDVSAC